jgi:hypothetical protein
MPDPIRFLTNWPYLRGIRVLPSANAAQIVRQDPLQHSVQIIGRNELRVWFEPRWRDGRYLARLFPHCLICSIPDECDTPALHRTPGWRRRRYIGIL